MQYDLIILILIFLIVTLVSNPGSSCKLLPLAGASGTIDMKVQKRSFPMYCNLTIIIMMSYIEGVVAVVAVVDGDGDGGDNDIIH